MAVTFLGSLRALLWKRGCQVNYEFCECRSAVSTHLFQCGLLKFSVERHNFTKSGFTLAGLGPEADVHAPTNQTSIAFRHFPALDAEGVADYITEWFTRGTFRVTEGQVQYVASSVGELFVNGFTHSESPIGVVAFGQYYPRPRTLNLVVMDLGVGIPETIRRRLPDRIGWLKPGKALEWAFEKGHSSTRTARGLGLAIMREFIGNNSGTMKVYSKNGYGYISDSTFFVDTSSSFPGTAVEISLKSVNFVPKSVEISF